MTDEDSEKRLVSRRGTIKAGGVALLTGIAGCSGQDTTPASNGGGGDGGGDGGDGGGGDGGDGGGGQVLEEAFTMPIGNIPSEIQYNVWNAKNSPNDNLDRLMHPKIVQQNRSGELVNVLAEEFDLPDVIEKGEEIEITLKEDLKYHDGKDLTAQSIVDNLYLFKKIQSATAVVYEDEQAVDETTFKVTSTGTMNGEVWHDMERTFPVRARGGNELHQPWVEKFRDATTEEETQQIRSDLFNATFDEPIGSGPFKFVRDSNSRILWERFEDWPHPTNVPQMEHLYIQDTIQKAVSSGKVDLARARTPWMLNENNWPPESHQPQYRREVEGPGGWDITFPMEHELFGRRNVRQAFAHIVNRWQLNQDQMPASAKDNLREEYLSAGTTRYPGTAIGEKQVEKYIRNPDNIPTYNYGKERSDIEENLNRAESLLKEEGFSKQGDSWVTPDGEPFEVTFEVESGRKTWAESVLGQLRRFGIGASLAIEEPSNYWADRQSKDALRSYFTGAGGLYKPANFPFINYSRQLNHTRSSGLVFTHGNGDELVEEYGDIFQAPTEEFQIEVEVPMPVGDMDGSTETINIAEKTRELKTLSGDEAKAVIEELAWAYTHVMHVFRMNQLVKNYIVTRDNWIFPEKGSEFDKGLQGQHHATAWTLGKVQAKTE